MAGIEKVCELSGDYPGYLMYKWKRRNIQVCPKYRDMFRRHIKDPLRECVLFIFKPDMKYDCFKGVWQREDNYMLYVQPKILKGSVSGRYYNYSKGDNLKHVFFNIWELLGKRDYHMSYIDLTLQEFYAEIDRVEDFDLLDFDRLGEVIGHWKILDSWKYLGGNNV